MTAEKRRERQKNSTEYCNCSSFINCPLFVMCCRKKKHSAPSQPTEVSAGLTGAPSSANLDVSVSESGSCTNQSSRSISSKSSKSNKSAKTIYDDTKSDKDWKTKYPPILTNNTNDGKLLMEDGRPFWHRANLNANGEYDEDEKSEKDLPMDADVLENVYDRRVNLAEMPRIIVHHSPYGPLDQLKKHTSELCTRDILMGNTVRAMVVLCDELSERDTSNKKNANDSNRDLLSISRKREAPTFVESTHVTLYDREHPTKPTRIVKLKELHTYVERDSEIAK